MDRAPTTPRAPLSPAQAAALRRTRELSVELAEIVGAVRAHMAALEAAGPPAEEGGLEADEMRDAFRAARLSSGSGDRPRWADTLLGGS